MPSLIKQKYWDASHGLQRWKTILLGNDHIFRDVVLRDRFLSPKAVTPISGETAERAAAAVRWLVAAQNATPDGDVSYGYFPVSPASGWEASYPETTGYTMTSLIAFARLTGQSDLVDRAKRMSLWK